MDNTINLMMYLTSKTVTTAKKVTYGCAGGFGYTYDVNVVGKKKLVKDVPTTTGYSIGGGSTTVVQPIDIITVKSAKRADEFSAVLDALKGIFEKCLEIEGFLNVGLITSHNWIEAALAANPEVVKTSPPKVGKFVFTEALVNQLIELLALKATLPAEAKVWVNYDKAVEGGLGMRCASNESAIAEVFSLYDPKPSLNVTRTPNKDYWNPESDFNKIVSGSRWYFKTGETGRYYDLYDGYRRYNFGKVDKKKHYYGKATPDVTYSTLFTKSPITLLDQLYDFAETHLENTKGLLLAGNLQLVKSKDISRLASTQPATVQGKQLVIPFKVGSKDDPTLIELLDPPGLSYRITDILTDLELIFHSFLHKTKENTYGMYQAFIDITDLIYVKETNGKGVTKLKLAPTFKQSTTTLRVEAHHPKAVKPVALHLGVGYDFPERTAFNSVEDPNVRVWVATEFKDDKCMYYTTLVETLDWVYVQAASHANLRVLNKSELGE